MLCPTAAPLLSQSTLHSTICCCCYTRMFTNCCWFLLGTGAGVVAGTFNDRAAVFLLQHSFCSQKHKLHISKQAQFCSSQRRCSCGTNRKRAEATNRSTRTRICVLLLVETASEPGNVDFIAPIVVLAACVVNVFFGGRTLK